MQTTETLTDKLTGKLFQDNPEINSYEYVTYNGDQMDLFELKALNEAGYVYHSEQTDIETDADWEESGIHTIINIYYFSKVENIDELHSQHMPY